jgi:enamine deaminase RidA (YjgF/YER057c/UK114 family)
VTRRHYDTGRPWETSCGYSRAVRVGPYAETALCSPCGSDGAVLHPGDVYRQTLACLDLVKEALEGVGMTLADVVKTRIYVADPAHRADILPMIAEQTRQPRELVEAIWGQYVFDPAFDQAYVADMENMTAYLVASGRVRQARNPLDYTYTDPVAAADPALVKVPGRWKP